LFYNDQKVLSAHEILSYLEVGDKLAYVTFGYLDKEHTPSEGFFASDYTTKETLFYDGKKIITDDSIEIYNISNKLAYVVSTKYGKKNLFYNNKKIVTADNITDIKPVGNKISYVISDYNADKKKLFVGDDLIVTKNNINYIDYINVKEINGKILYSVRDNLTEDIVTFYDSEMIGSNIDFMKIISSNIDNGLCYIIFDKTTLKNSLMCNKKIITENVSDFRVSDISSSTFFILKTEETASSTILSVYRLTL
jgi:hypothetical protein